MNEHKRDYLWPLLYLLFCLPQFFYNYRLLAFDVIPADSYYLFVRHWAGDYPTFQPTAPTGYRLLYLWSALPFYEWVPPLNFSRLPETASPANLAAKQALSLVGYLSTALLLWLTHIRVRRAFRYRAATAAGCALVVFFFLQFMAPFGTDPFALAYLSGILLLPPRSVVGLLLVGISFLANEKIALLLWVYHFPLWSSKDDYPLFLAATFAVSAYLALRYGYPLAGYQNQLDPSSYWTGAQEALPYLLSAKGLFLNVFPVVLLIGFTFGRSMQRRRLLFLCFSMGCLGIVLNLRYTIGSRTLYVLPFFVPVIADRVERLLAPTVP